MCSDRSYRTQVDEGTWINTIQQSFQHFSWHQGSLSSLSGSFILPALFCTFTEKFTRIQKKMLQIYVCDIFKRLQTRTRSWETVLAVQPQLPAGPSTTGSPGPQPVAATLLPQSSARPAWSPPSSGRAHTAPGLTDKHSYQTREYFAYLAKTISSIGHMYRICIDHDDDYATELGGNVFFVPQTSILITVLNDWLFYTLNIDICITLNKFLQLENQVHWNGSWICIIHFGCWSLLVWPSLNKLSYPDVFNLVPLSLTWDVFLHQEGKQPGSCYALYLSVSVCYSV